MVSSSDSNEKIGGILAICEYNAAVEIFYHIILVTKKIIYFGSCINQEFINRSSNYTFFIFTFSFFVIMYKL